MEPDISVSRSELREEFAGLRNEIGQLRREVRGEIGSMRSEIGELRSEVRGEIGSLRGEIGSLRNDAGSLRGEMVRGFERVGGRIDGLQVTLIRIGGGVIVGLVGVIAAVLARGV